MATASNPTVFTPPVPQAAILTSNWEGSALVAEGALHQLSPYIGKLKSSIAGSLIAQFSEPGDLLYDPYSGSGTVALEAWIAGRNVVANDLSPYAALLTRAKLFPYGSLDEAIDDLEALTDEADSVINHYIDLRRSPKWIREFFHPETLREVLAWSCILKRRRRWFLLASLMGILHHQRPGFLSYPSSHTVPYLRTKAFPPKRFPKLYGYRSVVERLEAKIGERFAVCQNSTMRLNATAIRGLRTSSHPPRGWTPLSRARHTCGSWTTHGTTACGCGFSVSGILAVSISSFHQGRKLFSS